MFENMSRNEAKTKVLEAVQAYCKQFPCDYGSVFVDGGRVQYAGHIFDHHEISALVDCGLGYWLAGGKYTEQFESGLGEYLELPYVSLVNSGSSANLIAFMALTSHMLGDRAISRGDEVITVAAGFPTTVSPIVQFGAVPVFVDITIPQYNIDVSMLDKALSGKTKAVMLAHTLGNPFDVQAVLDFCRKHNLWLVEDNCDALGTKIRVDGKVRYTGGIGDIGTSSFYPPHHITMGEGGAVYTKNELLHKIIRSLRDWGRDCCCPPGQDNICGQRFNQSHGNLPMGYDHKYVYSHFGYNLKATDMQAAVGCEQLKKLASFVEKRKQNFNKLSTLLSDMGNCLILPEPLPDSEPSWFGFLLTCKSGVERSKLVKHMESKNIQTRNLFAGNLLRHPCMTGLCENVDYRIVGNLANTDRAMQDTFWVGVYPGMSDKKIEYMAKMIKEGCGM